MDELVNSQIVSMRGVPGFVPPKSTVLAIKQHQYERFGPWQFNEIVGYIRLYFLGSQVRGEYFSAEKKRNLLGRTKVYTFRSWKLAPETELIDQHPPTNARIWEAIQGYVDKCRNELTKGRVIDDSGLVAIGPHVDWLSVLGWTL